MGIKAFKVGDKDYCEGDNGHGTTSMGGHGDSHGSEDHESTAGSMEGHGNAKCDFTDIMAADGSSYTVENIKTDEAGSWTIVFDKAQILTSPLKGSLSTPGTALTQLRERPNVKAVTQSTLRAPTLSRFQVPPISHGGSPSH